jgi:hypothetical protein
MRRFLPVIVLLAACHEPSVPTADSGGPAELGYTVSGVFYDSLADVPVPGVRVFVGDSSAVTDLSGHYEMRTSGSIVPIWVTNLAFEPIRREELLGRDIVLNLLGRRNAPWVGPCAFAGDSVEVTIIDLQGRKSIDRRSLSRVTVEGPGFTRQRDAYYWHWTPLDNFTWRVAVPIGQAGAERASWRLEDGDGFVTSSQCTGGPILCHDCAARRSLGRLMPP